MPDHEPQSDPNRDPNAELDVPNDPAPADGANYEDPASFPLASDVDSSGSDMFLMVDPGGSAELAAAVAADDGASDEFAVPEVQLDSYEDGEDGADAEEPALDLAPISEPESPAADAALQPAVATEAAPDNVVGDAQQQPAVEKSTSDSRKPATVASSAQERVDRKALKSQISEHQKQLKALASEQQEELRLLGLELLRKPEFEAFRGAESAEALGLDDQREQTQTLVDNIDKRLERSSALVQQRKSFKSRRTAIIKELGEQGVKIGQVAYEAFKEVDQPSERLQKVFARYRSMEPDKPAEPEKKSFFSVIKSTVGSVIPMGPSDAEKSAELGRIATEILAIEDLQSEIGSSELDAQLSAGKQYGPELNSIVVGIENSRREEASIRDELNNLKAEATTAKAKRDSAAAALKKLEAQLNKLVVPVAQTYLQALETAPKTDQSEIHVAKLRSLYAQQSDAQVQIDKLNAELRIDEIINEREKTTQKRHDLMKQIGELDRKLSDLHEEHLRLHELVTQISTGATTAIQVSEIKKPLESNFEAPLSVSAIANSAARARLSVTQANGKTFIIEVMAGTGIVFGRSHLDKQKGIRNDWVCRAFPREDPQSAQATRRISKVHGGVRIAPDGQFFMADWSTAGLTINHAPLQKSAWIPLPPKFHLDLAAGAIKLDCHVFPNDVLVMKRPPADERWYCVLSNNVGFVVQDGLVDVDTLSPDAPTDFAIAFKAGKFGVMPRPGRPDITVNGQPCESVQLLENGSTIHCEGCNFVFEQLPTDEPAV